MSRKAPIVLKFGGAALAHPKRVGERVRETQREGAPVILVVSAREGVTDILEGVLTRPRATSGHRRAIAELERIHPGMSAAGTTSLMRTERLVRRVEKSYPKDRPLGDRLLSQGERLAVHWLSGRLEDQGFRPVPVETDHLGLITDNAYGASCILFGRSEAPVRRGLHRILDRGELPVVTGYFGRSLEGRVATLGRGGSDYSAAGIGAIVRASRVELLKHNVSVLSADPREVPLARPIARLSYEEAEELAQFGARVLHPLTIEPARAYRVELRVRSLDDPSAVTTIGPARSSGGIRALTLLRPLRLLRIRVPGGRQRPGVVSEVSTRLSRANVNLVQLFTSSALLCLVLQPEHVRPALNALRPMMAAAAAVVNGPFPVALLTAIGDGILDDLDRLPGEVVRGAEGFSSTPRALSIAVPERRGPAALRLLHKALVEDRKP